MTTSLATMAPLMLVPLLVWVAVWFYLTSLDSKVKRLEREIARREDEAKSDQE